MYMACLRFGAFGCIRPLRSMFRCRFNRHSEKCTGCRSGGPVPHHFLPDTRDPEYTDWHRLSSRDDWGLFVHTFNELVSPDQYGKTHPEYYSLINGNRQPGTQLCLSNREVLAVLIANLKEKMAAKPGATYWSVSQNDNDQYCRCEPCTQLNAKYGGVPSGSILYFVNKVAKSFS